MKKLMIFSLVVLLFTALVGVASATPVDELTESAQYVPADALAYVVVRTDAGYLETLGAVWGSLLEKFPQGMVPPGSDFVDGLNALAAEYTGDETSTFADDIRPWLGDTVTAAIMSVAALDASQPVTYMLPVTDFDAARAFLDQTLVSDEGGYSYYEEAVEMEDGALMYLSDYSFDPVVVLREDMLLIGDQEYGIDMVLDGEMDSLADAEKFQMAMAALPLDDYNIAAYVDPAPIIDIVGMELAQEPDFPEIDTAAIAETIGQVGIGFTLLEGRALVMDAATTGTTHYEYVPLNLDLLAHVPADTPLLVQTRGLGDLVNMGFVALDRLDTFLREQELLPVVELGPFGDFGPTDLGSFIRFSVEGTYQFDLDETLAWMNADTLTYLRVIASDDSPLGFLPQLGNIMATDNPEATADYVRALGEMTQNAFAPTTIEDGVVTIPLGELFSMPELLTVQITSNDEVFVSGSQDMVAFALEPEAGESLMDTDSYAFESGLFLEDTNTLFYIDVAPLRDLFTALVAFSEEMNGEPVPESDVEAVNALLGLLDTSSITMAQLDDKMVGRLTLTLGE